MQQALHRPITPLDLLAQLQESENHGLERIGKKRIFAKNDFIFKAGQSDLNVYILNRGRVKIFGSSKAGRDVLLWFCIAGEVFGLAECLEEKPRLIYARAAEPCEILCVAQTQFFEYVASQPQIAFCLMKILAVRMRELGQRFLSLANGNIQMEIAQLLIRLGATHGRLAGPHIRMGIPLTEQDIADMVGSSRQGVSTCLAKMKRAGIIDISKHILTVKKQEELHQIAKGSEGIIALEDRPPQCAWRSAQSVG